MENNLSIRKVNAYLWLSVTIIALVSMFYVLNFSDLLEYGETEGFGYIGIVQSDTILFREIYLNGSLIAYLDAGLRNNLFPVMMWTVIDGNWYMSLFVNIALLFFTVIYLRKIAEHIHLNVGSKVMFLIVLLPETFIYLIGMLKEIPALLLFSAMTLYYLKNQWRRFIVCTILLVLLRYQLIAVVALFLTSQLIYRKYSVRFLVVVFVLLSAFYPLVVELVPGFGAENSELYREISGGSGFGSMIESIQFNVYGVSLLMTIVRLFQMVIEPWPSPQVFGAQGFNVIALMYTISVLVLLPIWFRFFKYLTYAIRFPASLSRDESVILCMSMSFLLIVALNGFVHHRYLYPAMGLILLIAYMPKDSSGESAWRRRPPV